MSQDDPLTPYGNQPMVTPIVNSVNYKYGSFEVLRQITEGEIEGYTYHRDDNPTVRAVEKRIAALEGTEDCVICTTGMAACTLVFLTYLKAGDQLLIFHDVYGANYKVSLILERFGVEVTWLNADEYLRIGDHVIEKTKMIFCETPSNPLCKIIDVAFLREQADKVGAMLVVDNSFATPIHQKPRQLGADLIIHSATKAMGGHNDIMAGAIACSKKDYEKLWFTRQAMGSTLDPFSASLLERGLKTLELRVKVMADNAMKVAKFLSGHPKVHNLRYAGLPGDPGHKVAVKQMTDGFSGLMAFDVGDDLAAAKRFISSLQVVVHAVSLGATESLICVPFLTTMLYLPAERRLSFGVKKNTVRFSAGIESTDEIIADLERALKSV